MKKILLLLLLLSAAACSGDQTPPGPQQPSAAEPPPPESGGEDMSSGRSPGPVTAPPDGGAYQFEACVKECIRRDQAKAIPIEQIEANCQGECAAEK
jgi:hypothetical protein